MTTTVFVTGSGTEVGKTFVLRQLVGALRHAGRTVHALKPIASGFDAAHVQDTDTGLLLAALGLPLTAANLDAISPWRFAAPLSPDMAAARERRAIPFAAVVELCNAPSPADVTLIEGIGGVMAPLDATHTVLDWIAAVGAPALLVTGSYLGSLSHTLTALAALRSRACRVLGIIVSESAAQPVPAEETAAVLRRFCGSSPVHVLPRVTAARAIDWLSLIDAAGHG